MYSFNISFPRLPTCRIWGNAQLFRSHFDQGFKCWCSQWFWLCSEIPHPLEKFVGLFSLSLNHVKICETTGHMPVSFWSEKSHIHTLVVFGIVQQKLLLGNIQLSKHVRWCLREAFLYSEVKSFVLSKIVYVLRNAKIKCKLVETDLILFTI